MKNQQMWLEEILRTELDVEGVYWDELLMEDEDDLEEIVN